VTVLTAVAAIAGLAFLLATLLWLASHWLHVAEDPRLAPVEERLPQSNCGACGFPGCRAFAEALVAGQAQPAGCTVGTVEAQQTIADLLGVAVGAVDKVVARLACAGGDNVSRARAAYQGPGTCLAAAQVAGGGKECFWGCLGFGDCERVCDFDAIVMDEHRLPRVVEDACTACGDCVAACPKDLFSLQPAEQRLWVRCRNQELGDGILEGCAVGCTGCARCAMDAPGLVTMVDNLPVIAGTGGTAARAREQGLAAIERCPTGAIVWIDALRGDTRGRESHRVVRQTARPTGET
jgi:Na+-translocating ferredoxin:NAD+ oxidoreductase RNF subunit RnfB